MITVAPENQVPIIIVSIVLIPLVMVLSEAIWRWLKPSKSLVNKHIIVVGGSQGIGKSLAIQGAQRNARAMTIISRSSENLEAAKHYIEAANANVRVMIISADVIKYEDVERAVHQAVQVNGPPDYLICAAGAAFPGYFMDQPMEIFSKSIALNYLGTVACVKACVPHMVAARSGHIVLVSSALGISGWLGYSAYSPAKFAVRGLAESLRNEFSGFNINVSVAYPPDTDTPGFAHENKTKPVETSEMLIPSIYSPDVVARYIWYSVLKGDFNCSCPDLLIDFLVALMSGVTPRRFVIFDVLIHPLAVMVSSAFRWNSDRIASKYPNRLSKDRTGKHNRY